MRLARCECVSLRLLKLILYIFAQSLVSPVNPLSTITVPCFLSFVCASILDEASTNWLNQSAEHVKQV